MKCSSHRLFGELNLDIACPSAMPMLLTVALIRMVWGLLCRWGKDAVFARDWNWKLTAYVADKETVAGLNQDLTVKHFRCQSMD